MNRWNRTLADQVSTPARSGSSRPHSLLAALACLALGFAAAGWTASAVADVLVSDDFPTNGNLTGTTPVVGGTWTTTSGTANQIQVVNNRVQLTDSASEDVETLFTSTTSGSVYFGFDISVADPGSYSGTDFEYFAHVSQQSTFNYTARTDIAAFSASGYRPGIATTAGTAEVSWGSDLAYDADYRLVVGYDFTTGLASLWVDPKAVTDTSITTSSSTVRASLDTFNFRQAGATPNQDFSIGQLRVATTFDEVLLAPPPVIPSLTWYGDGLTAGGSGTWSTAGSNWSENGGAAGGWDPTKKAVFDTTGGTVTVDGAGVTAETGIDFDVDGYAVTGGGITLGAGSNTVTVANGATATIDSVLIGTVTSFEKAGDGTLILGGANTFVGPASISGGRLEVSSEAALGDATNGLALAGGTFAPTGSLTLGAGRAVSGAGGLDIADGQTLTVNGDYSAGTTLANTGTLDLQGATRNVGSLTFNAAGTVTAVGGITGSGVTASTVSSGTATVVPALDLGAGIKTIVVGSGGTLDLQGGLTMTDRMNKDGEGTLILGSGSSIDRLSLGDAFTYAPGGVVRVSNAAALGSQTVFFNVGTVELTTPITMANGISFGGRSGSEAVLGGAGGNEALTVSGAVGFFGGTGSGEMVLNVNNVTTIDGGVTLATAASITGLTLGGSGTLNLTADSSTTLTAPVTLADTATLNVTGSIGGNVIVGGTNVLTGTGTIGGVVAGSGSVQPGASPGILTVGQVDPSGGASFVLEYTSALPDYTAATASLNDVIRVTDATPFSAAMTAANVVDMYLGVTSLSEGDSFQGGFFTDTPGNFAASVTDATLNYYVLGDGNGTDSTLAGQGYYTFANWKTATGASPDLRMALSTVAATANFAGGSVSGQAMTVSAVPEPSTIGLAVTAAGLASAALLRRRRRSGVAA
ncbi:MAG: autotransporter-associated beta strand repeat-containing protein [Planctomycetota bacterium]|nr:autotransporter-associated beta strand repeat-containing protein [Planctomycetota bacterium]